MRYETRILQTENRSLRARNIEIRMTEDKIYIIVSLPLNSLSSILRDERGREFREYIAPDCFRRALLTNKARNYKTKLLKNHYKSKEFDYNTMEFNEVDERELGFSFKLPKNDCI